MRRPVALRALLLAACIPVLISAGDRAGRSRVSENQATRPIPPVREQEGTEPASGPPPRNMSNEVKPRTRAPLYNMKRSSVHTGGDVRAASASYRAGVFVGEAVQGHASSASFRANVGFWFGVAGPAACPITVGGDLNENGEVTPADIITLVNYVFKAGPDPLPCAAAADMGCNGEISAADIIYIVNYVFRAGPDPCDVCALIPSQWTCP